MYNESATLCVTFGIAIGTDGIIIIVPLSQEVVNEEESLVGQRWDSTRGISQVNDNWQETFVWFGSDEY